MKTKEINVKNLKPAVSLSRRGLSVFQKRGSMKVKPRQGLPTPPVSITTAPEPEAPDAEARGGYTGETAFQLYLQEIGKTKLLTPQEEIILAECDPARSEDVRRNWPFLRDRRTDAYGKITERWDGGG